MRPPSDRRRDAGDLLLLILLAALPLFALRGLMFPPALGPPHPETPCPVPVEVSGAGVGCLPPAAARAARLSAGDRLSPGRLLLRGRMAPGRLGAWNAPVDLNRASLAELASLDGVGPRLAERIARARPFGKINELARVRGIGRKKLARMRPRLAIAQPRLE